MIQKTKKQTEKEAGQQVSKVSKEKVYFACNKPWPTNVRGGATEKSEKHSILKPNSRKRHLASE